MPSTPDPSTAWLVEIQSAILTIKNFCAGMDRAAYIADIRTCAAVAMYPIVIGEAARRLPQTVQDEAPEVPWPVVVSLRNRIAHGYSSIDHHVVWSIVDQHVPLLERAIQRMLLARGEA